MRKLLAYPLCILFAFTLGYLLLHPALRMIADWLSPLLGSSLLTLIVSAYLTLGDPLTYRELLLIWALTGILCGVIIRRRLGGISTAIGIYSTISAFMGLSLYNIIQRTRDLGLMGDGELLTAIPPLPKGLTIAHLMEAPIIGPLIERLTALMTGGMPSMESMRELLSTLITQILSPIIIGSAKNIVIVAVSALIGVEVGRLLEKALKPTSESLRNRLRGEAAAALILMLFLLPSASIQGLGEGVYVENLIGVADDFGRSYVAALFLDSTLSIGGINIQSPEAEGLLASVVVTHEGLIDLLREAMRGGGMGGLDLSSLMELAPPTLLLTIYLDTPLEVAEERSSSIASAFSKQLDIDFHRLLSLSKELNTTEGPRQICLSIYTSPADVDRLAEGYLSLIPSSRGGLAEAVVDAYKAGRLGESVDGILLYAGIINPLTIMRYLPMEQVEALNLTEIILPRVEGGIGVSGLIGYWRRGVHSPPNMHTLSLSELLGVEELSFSPDAAASNLLILIMNTTIGKPIYGKLYTTLPLKHPPAGMMVETLPQGASISASALSATFEASLPPEIEVVKTVSPTVVDPGEEVTVTVTIENLGDEAIEAVQLNDSQTAQYYPISLQLSGSTADSWQRIEAGSSRSITYKLTPKAGGIYTLSPALVTYRWRDKEYIAISESVEFRVRQPPPHAIIIDMLMGLWMDAARILDILVQGRGTQLMQLITAVVVILLAVQEARNIRKWLRGD
ncbi:MAG TPA: DUF11 domain-containing protein [Candidatus Bathyarchaeota archaeon]|nr:DUF11 domain-containing protein [Candidatus Bathyarchaeota archaeon]